MKKIHHAITINASKEKVWNVIIGEKTYPEWTSVFDPSGPNNSSGYIEGSWEKGSPIKFLAKDEKGEVGGMVSEIAENKPFEFLSIRHLGWIKDGVEDTTSEEIKAWAPSYENYTLTEKDGMTEFVVDMDATDDFYDFFQETWPKALEKVKKIAEA